MASPRSDDAEKRYVDPSLPFKGIVVCCTSIGPEQRTRIDLKVAELGGVHKYDLTPDVTHLIVGDYDTPKYRHVARERQDVRCMDARWIEAVNELWRDDQDADYAALEREHQLRPLERGTGGEDVAPVDKKPEPDADETQPSGRLALLICLTGFGDQRDAIADLIRSNGGHYKGDLTRRCTHLIVSKPEGKKFAAAQSWGIRAVTLDWLHQSIARGMILDESRFDPLLPADEQGVGAWTRRDPAAGSKRSRSAVANGAGAGEADTSGARKLRKTASMKLSSQRNNLWGDILGRPASREYSFAREDPHGEAADDRTQPQPPPIQNQGVLSSCVFYTHGFGPQRTPVLRETLASLGGHIAISLEQAATCLPASDSHQPWHRFLVVPQSSQPDTHPPTPRDDMHVVTEFYVERCLHHRRFLDPSEHVLGRPFPLFPIPGFAGLAVCSAAFTGIELSQVARAVTQLGGAFEEEFRRSVSLVVCRELSAVRKEKLRLALSWGVPVVSADWLWECISTGFHVPIDDFVLQAGKDKEKAPEEARSSKAPAQRTRSEPTRQHRPARPNAQRPAERAGVDATAFDHDSPAKQAKPVPKQDSTTSADFDTARTQPIEPSGHGHDRALSELSSASLNKSPSPTKPATGPLRIKSDPLGKSTTDPPGAGPPPERAPSAPPVSVPAPAGDKDKDEKAVAEAKSRARAAEHRSKLTDLIDSATPAAVLAAGDAALGSHPHPQPPSRPRRRQVLGRAISNVSAGSSAASGAVDHHRPSAKSAAESLRAGDDDWDAEGEGDSPPAPPATQLGYVDPEAQEARAALMSRMMNVEGGGAAEISGEGASVVGGRVLRKR